MDEKYYVVDERKEDNSLLFKEAVLKYLTYWKWFLIAILTTLFLAFVYLRYAPVVYASAAKIKIIDDTKELDIAVDPLSLLKSGSKINVDNEIEILKSYRILEQVVNSLNLEISYYEKGNIKTKQIFKPPFQIKRKFIDDSIKTNTTYYLNFDKGTPEIIDQNGVTSKINSKNFLFSSSKYPVEVSLDTPLNLSNYQSDNFSVVIKKTKEAVLNLSKALKIELPNNNSEVLYLKLKSESPELSEAILNEIIKKFDEDGILDRQLVSKRTMDFIDERIVFLSQTLDSIESEKKDFKQANKLSYIEADAGITLQKKSTSEKEVFDLETQMSLSKLLKRNLKQDDSFKLLPSDIGLQNASINSLISEYNAIVLEREKLAVSAGVNNPSIRLLTDQLTRGKENISRTINTYISQLRVSLNQLKRQKYSASTVFSKLPEKEKMLRAIERQQSIKENLFLLLLQKREEAAINFAVTAPSVKVVDYGLTNSKPIFPKKSIIILIALSLGIILPFIILFLKFNLDTTITNKSQLERLTNGNIAVLAEIPNVKDNKGFFNVNEQSVKAESFRLLGTNLNYVVPNDILNSPVIYVTSSIKGEGKTFISLNMSMALSNLNNKVLLIGGDLRNPQLHTYFNKDKDTRGLSNCLHNPKLKWSDGIHKLDGINENLDVCLSGPIPPNPLQLLAGNRFKDFLEDAKKNYDYIIVDMPPTIQVADTLLVSKYADVTIFVIRSNYTEKRLIEFSKDLHKNSKLKNITYVLNDVKFNKLNGYNYGYEYGYLKQ